MSELRSYFPPVTAWPRTYLLKELWHRKHPLISIYERPGGGDGPE